VRYVTYVYNITYNPFKMVIGLFEIIECRIIHTTKVCASIHHVCGFNHRFTQSSIHQHRHHDFRIKENNTKCP
jgi:hypothetical protein